MIRRADRPPSLCSLPAAGPEDRPVWSDGVRARVASIVEALTGETWSGPDEGLITELTGALNAGAPAEFWLVLSVLRGEFPDTATIDAARREARLEGVEWFLRRELDQLISAERSGELAPVEVLTDAVTVDVHHTASVRFTSGIQRVVRETVRRWMGIGDPVLVGWTEHFRAFRRLSDDEQQRFLDGRGASIEMGRATARPAVLVPWRGMHLVPELIAEPARTLRLQPMAAYSATSLGVIGYDCIPVTSGETVAPGMTSNFALYLAAVRGADRIAPISRSSAEEFLGWRQMIRSAGYQGPDIREIELPVHARESQEDEIREARRRLCLPGTPLLLVVGSHEPRKNHMAVLHAAQILWREGHRFSLCFVGSGSWRADAFYAEVDHLRSAGLPVEYISRMSDSLLWAAYRVARCVVFPSLNEGFGLPVAEALAAGTPVVTSDFGSMREIVAPDGVPLGGLLVDPRDDGSLADGMRTMLADRVAYLRMRAEASRRRLGTWDDYARATWTYLVDGAVPNTVMDPSDSATGSVSVA